MGADCFLHDAEDLEAGIFGLRKSLSENISRDAIDLRVELECGYKLCSSSDLEVHVTKRVLCTENVGEGRVLAFCVDKPHRNTSNRSL